MRIGSACDYASFRTPMHESRLPIRVRMPTMDLSGKGPEQKASKEGIVNEEQNVHQGISRRNFLGAAAIAAATMGAGLAGCSQSERQESKSDDTAASNIEWSGEADVIIMGFGGAGGTAAIEAARHGSKVLLFEKAPEEHAGGNSSVCEGASFLAADREKAFELLRKLTDESSVTDNEIYAFVDNNMKEIDWFKDALGMECAVRELDAATAQWGSIRSGEAFHSITQNPTFYMNISDTVRKTEEIEVHYESPVIDFVLNAPSGEIQGVVVETAEGKKKYKARRSVVMACGSFEGSKYMIEQYCYDPLPEVHPLGTPYNTGDGISMAQKVGAQMRHMAGLEFGAYCFRKPTEELGTTVAMNNHWDDLDHLIAVNKSGKRFMNEALRTQSGALPHPGHDKSTLKELEYDGINFEYPNLPFWFIFDDERRASHALGTWASKEATSGWTARHQLYMWSDDNQAEIEKGWIVKADSITELAEKINVPAETLEETVSDYNAGCESGSDEFGRVENLTPVQTGPFYASDMSLAFINAQGGPRRNEDYQVMGVDGNPIPRLFAAGEFGSIWGHNYHGGLNVPEAMCGFAAGASAAAVDPME